MIIGDNFERQQAMVQARLEIANLGAAITKWEIFNDRQLRIEASYANQKVVVPLVFKRDLFKLRMAQFVSRVQTIVIQEMERTALFVQEPELLVEDVETEPEINYVPFPSYLPSDLVYSNVQSSLVISPISVPVAELVKEQEQYPPYTPGMDVTLSVAAMSETEKANTARPDVPRYLKKNESVEVIDPKVTKGVAVYINSQRTMELPQNSIHMARKVLYYDEERCLSFKAETSDRKPIVCGNLKAQHNAFDMSGRGGRLTFPPCKGALCGSKNPLLVILTVQGTAGDTEYFLQLVTSTKIKRTSQLHAMFTKINGVIETGEEAVFRLRTPVDQAVILQAGTLGLQYDTYGLTQKNTGIYEMRLVVYSADVEGRFDLRFKYKGKEIETVNLRLSCPKKALSFAIPGNKPLVEILDYLDRTPDHFNYVPRPPHGVYYFYYFEGEKIRKHLNQYHSALGMFSLLYEEQNAYDENRKPKVERI